MATQQQEQQPDKLQAQGNRFKKLFQRTLVITSLFKDPTLWTGDIAINVLD